MSAEEIFEPGPDADASVATPRAGSVATVSMRHARASDDSSDSNYSTQSFKRAVSSGRVNPDDPKFVWSIAVGVAIAGLVAFAISFVSLMQVAAWLGLPTWMHWAVPVFIDLAILVYAGSVLIHKSRGEQAWPSWVMLGMFTLLSVVANVSHALSFGTGVTESWQSIVGACMAGMVPVAVFTATEQLSRVAVIDPTVRREELAALARWESEMATREREQVQVEIDRERMRRTAELEAEEHESRLAEIRAERELRVRRALEGPAVRDDRELRVVETKDESASGDGTGDLDEVAAFVRSRSEQGLETSGTDLSQEFGFSSKTGRRRLAKLREERPEVFSHASE